MICTDCKTDKPETDFYYTGKYIRHYCKNCEHIKQWNRKKQKHQNWLLEYGNECSRCGYNKCYWALEFHHVNMDRKGDTTPALVTKHHSYERAKKELEKCVLVCANCHREIHAGL